jgi:hypothetical protein
MEVSEFIFTELSNRGFDSKQLESRIVFSKEAIEIHFVEQGFDGVDIYLKYEDHFVELDWTLLVYNKETTIKKVARNIGEKSLQQIESNMRNLLFKSGDFIIDLNYGLIREFVEWYEEQSESIYRRYLDSL